MKHDTRKALYQNALAMVWADGHLSATEASFIGKLQQRAGIEPAQAAAWRREMQDKPVELAPVANLEEARQILDLLIGAAAADGNLAAEERRMLASWGKALGMPLAELKSLVTSRWTADVLEDLFGAPPFGDTVYVISDHFARLIEFLEVNPRTRLEVRTLELARAQGLRPACFVFHAAPEKAESVALVKRLRGQAMGAKLIPVVSRHQAFQISYLKEAGAFGCLVEDVYPGELDALLAESTAVT